jgi:hypothetical protein
MTSKWTSVHGTLVEGYGVASGRSNDYPYGALERQKPIFKERGLDLSRFFDGTLNIDIRPATFELLNPEFTFRDVRWTDLHPPEHFSFVRCDIVHGTTCYGGWIYYPHPETKKRNFQNPSLLEIITVYISGIRHGDEFEVRLNPARVGISHS